MRITNGLWRQAAMRLCGLRRAGRQERDYGGNQPGARRGPAPCLGGDQGSALVEFALVAPLLLTLLTGTASFSMALFSYQELGNAASNAALLLSEEQGLTTDPCATVATSVTGALPTWTASKMTYTVMITDSSGTEHTYGPTAGSSFSCAAGAAEMAEDEPVTVQLTYKYTWAPILNFSPSSALSTSETESTE